MERCRRQIAPFGIEAPALPDVAWLVGDTGAFGLSPHYALLVPESSPSRPDGRWSAERYGCLAQALSSEGLQPVIVGTSAAEEEAARIRALCPSIIDLTGRAGLPQLASLARNAVVAVGTVSPTLSLIAATGCPTLALFAGVSAPVNPPAGPRVTLLGRARLSEMEPAEVLTAIVAVLHGSPENRSRPMTEGMDVAGV